MLPDERQMIDECLHESDNLSEWEFQFCDGLADKDDDSQGRLQLTDAQHLKLVAIHREKVKGERRDPHHRDGIPAKTTIKAIAGMASMPMIVVYKNPKDFPGQFVARRFECKPDGTCQSFTKPVAVKLDYDKVREAVKANLPGATRIARDPQDDPVILEVWL